MLSIVQFFLCPCIFYSVIHSCSPICFSCTFNWKVLCCAVILKMCECVSSESPRLTHFMSFTLMNPCIPSLLVPENLFLCESPFIAVLCVWITCLVLRLHCRFLLLLIRPSGAALCHLEGEMRAVGCGSVWDIIRTEHSHGWMGCVGGSSVDRIKTG